jgi:two-component system osmolarity sensor histidine kinase EnvZ
MNAARDDTALPDEDAGRGGFVGAFAALHRRHMALYRHLWMLIAERAIWIADRPAMRPLKPVWRFLGRYGLIPLYVRTARAIGRSMPKGLYARSLIIIIAPIVLLQAVVAFVFMERHWELVTRRLSAATVREVAAMVDILEAYPGDEDLTRIAAIAGDRMNIQLSILPAGPLPPPTPKPFFNILDNALSDEIGHQIGLPFWIDTVGNSRLVEIRIQLPDKIMRVIAPRSQAYASNSHIFIVWMVVASLILLSIAILFLRNQIRPMERLAEAAERFGKGRAMPDFQPRGAREVRQASQAFIDMRERIERQIEQRTTMLAGVSHDLRTILTRFRLQLAFFEDMPDVDELRADVDDMQRMLEVYLAFARGDAGEASSATDVAELIEEVAEETPGGIVRTFSGDPIVPLRPQAFKRCLTNLVTNACRHGSAVAISGRHADGWLTIDIDDDGPGIPPSEHEAVFRPFYRLDDARNLDKSGTGLGLAIARDAARGHGGDIVLGTGPLGGLRATVRIPA